MQKGFGPPPDKKIPENKKYSHIASSIDTGASAKKAGTAPSTSGIARRRDEIFKRIKAATLVQLIQEREGLENESVYAMGPGSENHPGQSQCGVSNSSVIASKAGGATQASLAPSVTSVAGSVLSVIQSDITVSEARDLVLLDLREPDEFAKCHLPMAESYPVTKLNRDQFSPDLLRCKRDTGKLLVVYHINDAQTAAAASLFVQKGWENTHCLSGGFEELVASYPEVLQGDVPDRPPTGASSAVGRR